MKFSVTVEPRVSSHSYKFQLDLADYCRTLGISGIGSYRVSRVKVLSILKRIFRHFPY